MKIGVMTFWWSNDNYGQLLQCYALQKYLRDLGHDAFLIQYKPENRKPEKSFKRLLKIFNPSKVFQYFSNKKHQKRLIKLQQINLSRNFDDFRSKYIIQSEKKYSSYNELKVNPPEADAYIVGSDQVWSGLSVEAKENTKVYCLQFAPKNTKRISYAASFGVDSLNEEVLTYIQPMLRGFSSISVRENTGKEICNKIGINADLVCDPTLLLNKTQWAQLIDCAEKQTKKFVFLYLLTNTCEFSVSELKKWADARNLDLVYVNGNTLFYQTDFDDKNITKSYLTINQWLYYLSNAEYVITNSFHGCVFSLIFSKKIAVVPLTSFLKRTNDRIRSLFSNLDVKKIEIIRNDFSVLEQCQEQCVNETFIEESKRLLSLYLT